MTYVGPTTATGRIARDPTYRLGVRPGSTSISGRRTIRRRNVDIPSSGSDTESKLLAERGVRGAESAVLGPNGHAP
jgi:hypothetical protein